MIFFFEGGKVVGSYLLWCSGIFWGWSFAFGCCFFVVLWREGVFCFLFGWLMGVWVVYCVFLFLLGKFEVGEKFV